MDWPSVAFAGLTAVFAVTCSVPSLAQHKFRPPSVPLVACDPYFSIWSPADHLYDAPTVHWTGAPHTLASLIRVDGTAYRLMGTAPAGIAPMPQVGLQVLPTRSIYEFRSPKVAVTLTFMNAALPDDLDALSRPVTYLIWKVRSADGRPHEVSILMAASSELAVNTPDQQVEWAAEHSPSLTALRVGTVEQPILERSGDGVRIDWGYAYLTAPQASASTVAPLADCLNLFAEEDRLPPFDNRMPKAVRDGLPALAVVMRPGRVSVRGKSVFAVLAYDDLYSINYFGTWLRGYWRRNGRDAAQLLEAAVADYPRLARRCTAFDRDLMGDLSRVGGAKYAQLCALAYRQCIAACKLAADRSGMPMLFPKENTSNGCISTVDVIYPMDPIFLLLSPMLAKASVAPVLNYTASPMWHFRYAPHDLGTYPQATRQVYGGDDPAHEGDRMPVEESGNMILLLAAIAKVEGSAEFASRYWPQVTQWAHYLEEKGFDPENQLCTDDFTGHLAHNANLSVKAIEALGAYALLCSMRGEREEAGHYQSLARRMAAQWVKAADDGDHFRLAFDKPGTWSQKYNMVWDTILGLDLFGPQVRNKELAFYLAAKDRYGLALDNRQPYAKTDWAVWTASLAPTRRQFQELVDPVYDFLDSTPDRTPMTDLYWTKTGREVGMHARPVVGGVFIRMLCNEEIWKKWASQAPNDLNARWAPLPKPPAEQVVVPTAEKDAVLWRCTTSQPGPDWMQPEYRDAGWAEAPAPFGTTGTPGIAPRTEWHTGDIWLRRIITIPPGISLKHEGLQRGLMFRAYHDEDVEIYVDGVLGGRASGFVTSYGLIPIRPAALKLLTPGPHLLAVHCRQTEGGQGVDVGIVEVKD
ncbi:MAG: glutaminase domain-containing protein [Chthonomonadales bacterium]